MISCSEIRKSRGRSPKYSRKMIKVTRDYLLTCAENNETPFIEELALKIGVNDSTLWRWSNIYPEYEEAYQMLLTFQKLDLKKKALTGKYVSKIACLLLSNDHNVTLKQKTELEARVVEEKHDTLTPDQRKLYSEAITRVFEQIYSQPQVALS